MHGSVVACCGSGALRATVHTYKVPLKEVAFIFITSTVVWSQGKQQGGNTAPPIKRELDSRFTEHDSALQNKTQFPTQSVSPKRKLP